MSAFLTFELFLLTFVYYDLKVSISRCATKSTSKKNEGHKNSLYCYLHIYNESTKRVVHLCLDPRGRSPQIKQDNVHMKKTSPPLLNMHHSLYYPAYSLFHIFLTSLPFNPGIYLPFIMAHKSIFPIM